jgi:dTDP-L-rhamnose 4-epimerase
MARTLHAVRAAAAPAPRVTGAYRLGDVRHVFADPACARRRLGFVAREDFAAGMAEFAHAELREPARRRT